LLEDRFSRQRRVAEVGSAGQALIGRLTVTLPEAGAAAADVAAIYLSRAGVSVERCGQAPEASFAHAHAFSSDGPRALAQGAHRALAAIREALGVDARGLARGRELYRER
jgi:hypothetical protein